MTRRSTRVQLKLDLPRDTRHEARGQVMFRSFVVSQCFHAKHWLTAYTEALALTLTAVDKYPSHELELGMFFFSLSQHLLHTSLLLDAVLRFLSEGARLATEGLRRRA
eukprot:5117084-Pleurochrysis_carterae.AAC.1